MTHLEATAIRNQKKKDKIVDLSVYKLCDDYQNIEGSRETFISRKELKKELIKIKSREYIINFVNSNLKQIPVSGDKKEETFSEILELVGSEGLKCHKVVYPNRKEKYILEFDFGAKWEIVEQVAK